MLKIPRTISMASEQSKTSIHRTTESVRGDLTASASRSSTTRSMTSLSRKGTRPVPRTDGDVTNAGITAGIAWTVSDRGTVSWWLLQNPLSVTTFALPSKHGHLCGLSEDVGFIFLAESSRKHPGIMMYVLNSKGVELYVACIRKFENDAMIHIRASFCTRNKLIVATNHNDVFLVHLGTECVQNIQPVCDVTKLSDQKTEKYSTPSRLLKGLFGWSNTPAKGLHCTHPIRFLSFQEQGSHVAVATRHWVKVFHVDDHRCESSFKFHIDLPTGARVLAMTFGRCSSGLSCLHILYLESEVNETQVVEGIRLTVGSYERNGTLIGTRIITEDTEVTGTLLTSTRVKSDKKDSVSLRDDTSEASEDSDVSSVGENPQTSRGSSKANMIAQISIMDDTFHVFTKEYYIVRGSEACDVTRAHDPNRVLRTRIAMGGGGDSERMVWYYSHREGLIVHPATAGRRGRKIENASSKDQIEKEHEDDTNQGFLSQSTTARFAALLGDLRYDTLNPKVIHLSHSIVSELRVHHGNWNRTDLAAEDSNLVMHISLQLKIKQEQWEEFLSYLQHSAVWTSLTVTTKSQVLHHGEMLDVLHALRETQNDISSSSSSVTIRNHFSEILNVVARQIASDKGGSDSSVRAYASNSELFYSSIETPILLIQRLRDQAKDFEMHSYQQNRSQMIALAEFAAVIVQTYTDALSQTRTRRLHAALERENVGSGALPLWTSLPSFLDALAQILHFLSTAICLIELDSEASFSNSWSAREAVCADGKQRDNNSVRDFLFQALSVGCDLHLSNSTVINASHSRSLGEECTIEPQCELRSSQLLMALFMRMPIVQEPIGYPHGPTEVRFPSPFRIQWIAKFQELCKRFQAYTALIALIASCPAYAPEDVIRKSHQRLGEAIENLPNFARHLVVAWQRDARAFELLSLAQHLSGSAKDIFETELNSDSLHPQLRWMNHWDHGDIYQCSKDLLMTSRTRGISVEQSRIHLVLAKFACANNATSHTPGELISSIKDSINGDLELLRTQARFAPQQREPMTADTLVELLTHQDIAAHSHNTSMEQTEEALIAAAALITPCVKDVQRRIRLLLPIVDKSVQLDASKGIFQCISRHSELTEREMEACLMHSTVLKCANVCDSLQQWCIRGTTHPKELDPKVRETLLLLGQANAMIQSQKYTE